MSLKIYAKSLTLALSLFSLTGEASKMLLTEVPLNGTRCYYQQFSNKYMRETPGQKLDLMAVVVTSLPDNLKIEVMGREAGDNKLLYTRLENCAVHEMKELGGVYYTCRGLFITPSEYASAVHVQMRGDGISLNSADRIVRVNLSGGDAANNDYHIDWADKYQQCKDLLVQIKNRE